LDSLYQSIGHESSERKKVLKEKMIENIVERMDTIEFSSGRKPSKRFKEKLPNNAYFMSSIQYQGGQDELWTEWKQSFDGDLKAYINHFKEKFPFL
jgi:hypothetical protein